MTITRLDQLTAEMNTTQGLALFSGSTYPAISTTKYKTGARSYRPSGSSDAPFGVSFAAVTAVRCGFWINHSAAAAGNPPSLISLTVGASRVRVLWAPIGNLWQLLLGYQQSSTSYYQPIADTDAGSFSQTDTWRHIGVTYKCDATGFFSLYVDGVQVLNYVGDTTVYKSNYASKEAASITGFYVCGMHATNGWGNYVYADDIYVDSIVGETDHVPPGKRFLFSLADAAGADAQWTPLSSTNISQVDDPVSSVNDGDTTYNKALSATLKDTFNTAAITVPADHSLRAAIPIAIARKTDTVASTLKLHAYDGSTYLSSAAKTLATSYAPVFEYMPLQPDGTAWNETDFNAMQFGVESAGSFT